MSDKDDLYEVSRRALSTAKRVDSVEISVPLEKLEHEATRISKSWSGSWLGYHSLIYYENFSHPPPGARFSQEWGLKEIYGSYGTVGNWCELNYDEVIAYIEEQAGSPNFDAIEDAVADVIDTFQDLQSTLVSRLSNALRKDPEDTFLQDLLAQAKKEKIYTASDFVSVMQPQGQVMSRDMPAIQKGMCVPPHLNIVARVNSARQPFHACRDLGKIAQRAASHLSDSDEKQVQNSRIGTNVFIGHGRSGAWKDLRDFVRDRVHLPWDEFNRVPIAGFTNIARLSQMMDGAAIAFIIMTAEDEQKDGTLNARMNVIHEAGLFQGRLGFERAILLLEEGCEEFSNVQGLGQIRFPTGNISAVFEQIRQVLEREGLVT